MQKLFLQLFISFLLHGIHVRGQENYTITPYTPGDGLVSADILSLYQDSKNYLWVGHAAGVSRYDGYQFQNFLFTAEHRLGKTYAITEDQFSNVWIGAENGLFLYRHGKLRSITLDNRPRPIYAIAFSKEGLWIGSSEGPSYFTSEQWQQAIATCNLPLHKHVITGWQRYFKETRQVVFLSIGNDGAAYFGDGYAIFKWYDNRIEPVWTAQSGQDPLKSIIAIDKDSVFICSSYNGLQAVENGKYRKATARLGPANSLIQKNGRLYAYFMNGIYEFDPRTFDARQLFPFTSNRWEWGSILLQDNENNFWVGTHEQLCYARRNFFTSIHQPLYGFDELYSVNKLSDGSMLCGSNRGKLFRRSDSSSFKEWLKVFPVAPVTAIYEEKDGNIWFASAYQGIALFDKNNVRRFTVDEGLRDNSNFFLFKTSRGQLFTGGDGGVSMIIHNEKGNVHFNNFPYKTGSTDYVIVNGGLENPAGGIIFGSNRGLLEINKDSLANAYIKNAPRRDYNISDMRQDAHGNIWISTIGDGILLCAFENKTLVLKKQLQEKDGLSSSIWLRLLVDANNIVWVAGYNGITRIEKTGGQFFIAQYGKMHGFIPQLFHTVKMMQDEKGIIWVATSSGLMQFNPAAPRPMEYPYVQINQITLNDTGSINNFSQPLQLPYDINTISFNWTGIYFSDPASVTYAYRLVGQDTGWVQASNNRTVSFRHLPPGAYRFEVRAAAGTNRWSNIIPCEFTILPPFWQRWWFIALSTIVASLLMFAVIRSYVNNIQRREEEKTRVQQLISENKQKALEAKLQSMRLQMNPHFLFNALNSIQQMILSGDETVATRCLSKFSKLLRLILIHSDREKVTLREELQTLRLYVELESFRFKDRFEYFITCDNTIDQDDTSIPTLLIQPFVENAIWHGLMHKEGIRRLQVHFTEEKDLVTCIIEDNGIGRAASRAIKQNSLHENSHTGKGIAVAGERLKIFGEQSSNGCGLQIIDLTDAQGNAAGTRVVVKFLA